MKSIIVDNTISIDDNDEDAFAVFDNIDELQNTTECNQTNQVQMAPTYECTSIMTEHTQQVLESDDSKMLQKQEHQQISHGSGITVLSFDNNEEDVEKSKNSAAKITNTGSNNMSHASINKDISCSNSVNKLGQIRLEKNSNIRVKRCTRSFDQLPVLLAQYPFATFSQVRLLISQCCSNSFTLARCCVGVVSYRGEPKQNNKNTSHNTFAVVRIWNMHGFSPSSSEELSLLLCNSAFDVLYSQLMLGSVIAVVNLSLLSSLSTTSLQNTNSSEKSTKHDGLYRVHDIDQIRLLGYAAELGTCSATTKTSQERCHNLVNTHISQYCMYHLHEVKKVARGGVVSVNKTIPMNNNNNKSFTNKSNQLSYMFANNKQPTPVIPTLTSSSPLLNATRQQSSASRTALLKQPSFLIVKGNNGLPVHSPATQHRMSIGGNLNSENTNNCNYENKMCGEGIYAGVCKGSALSISNKINSSLIHNSHQKGTLNPNNLNCNSSINNNNKNNTHNTHYPSMSVHNITTRGRDVLAIAQQQEDAQQQARLLRSALYTNAATLSKETGNVIDKNKPKETKLRSAVNGDLHTSKSEQRSVKRVRGDDETQLEESERLMSTNTTTKEADKGKRRRRGSDVNVSSNRMSFSENKSASKSIYQSRQTMKSYHKINDELIRAVKEQCAPLNSTTSSSALSSSDVYYVPETNLERVELVIDYQNTNSNDSSNKEANINMCNEIVNRRKCNQGNAKKQIITQTLSGHRSALVNTVAKAIRNKVILPSSSSSELINTLEQKPREEQSSQQTEKSHLQQEVSSPFSLMVNINNKNNNDNSSAITLLGEIASQMHSAHDSLRSEAEVNRLNAQLDKSIAQEKAIELLSSIHEQPIEATYCYHCSSWSTRALDSCVKARHRLEVKQTVKRFIECEYCHYKTFVLGNEAESASHAWKLLPCCPRCHQRCVWNKSNAAQNYSTSRHTQYMTSSETNTGNNDN